MADADERVISSAARAKFAWLVTAAQGVAGAAGLYFGCGRPVQSRLFGAHTRAISPAQVPGVQHVLLVHTVRLVAGPLLRRALRLLRLLLASELCRASGTRGCCAVRLRERRSCRCRGCLDRPTEQLWGPVWLQVLRHGPGMAARQAKVAQTRRSDTSYPPNAAKSYCNQAS